MRRRSVCRSGGGRASPGVDVAHLLGAGLKGDEAEADGVDEVADGHAELAARGERERVGLVADEEVGEGAKDALLLFGLHLGERDLSLRCGDLDAGAGGGGERDGREVEVFAGVEGPGGAAGGEAGRADRERDRAGCDGGEGVGASPPAATAVRGVGGEAGVRVGAGASVTIAPLMAAPSVSATKPEMEPGVFARADCGCGALGGAAVGEGGGASAGAAGASLGQWSARAAREQSERKRKRWRGQSAWSGDCRTSRRSCGGLLIG